MATKKDYEAIVVGTGFAGLYSLYLLKQLGLDVKGLEAGSDVGGTCTSYDERCFYRCHH
jgi:cation diffusion facilitator CzcD-associated flavoprotein CzcO